MWMEGREKWERIREVGEERGSERRGEVVGEDVIMKRKVICYPT